MKPQRKNHVIRTAGVGFGIFLILSALCLLTPLRGPVLAAAGRDTPALHYRLSAQRHAMDSLQTVSSSRRLTPAERASLENVREAYVATRERIDARERMNARFSLLGLFDWITELFPWLLAFGLALPVLGGLIGVQRSVGRGVSVPKDSQFSAAPSRPAPPAPPVSSPPPLRPTPPGGGSVRTAYVHPAVAAATAAAHASTSSTPSTPSPAPVAPPLNFSAHLRPLPGSPVVLPPDILSPAGSSTPVSPASAAAESSTPEASTEAWGFPHQPKPLESRPRPKMPPVRSAPLTDPFGGDTDDRSGV